MIWRLFHSGNTCIAYTLIRCSQRAVFALCLTLVLPGGARALLADQTGEPVSFAVNPDLAFDLARIDRLLQRAGTTGDTDGDGIDDVTDMDDDNDTIPDSSEGTGDTDGDGVPDCLDADSDNDGIPDLIEAVADRQLLGSLDRDGDSRLDASLAVGANGLVDRVETSVDSGDSITGFNDGDGDGLFDQIDLDADNDGVPDVVEIGSSDGDFNGLLDRFRDIDGDGLDDQLASFPIAIRDTDDDGEFNFRDIDSDQDGLGDAREASGNDADGDGRIDVFVDVNRDGLADSYVENRLAPRDTDGDRISDYIDSDSDNDGIPDADEGGTAASMTQPDTSAPMVAADGSELVTADTLVTGRHGSVLGGCNVTSVRRFPGDARTAGEVDPTLTVFVLIALAWLVGRAVNSVTNFWSPQSSGQDEKSKAYWAYFKVFQHSPGGCGGEKCY